jgi:enoyl-[acyl-carrier protein] reductase I
MYPIDLAGKNAVVFGVANHRSIAWGITQILHQAGANVAFAYQNGRVRDTVTELAESLGDVPLIECDVSSDDNVEAAFRQVGDRLGSLDILVHSIAYANRDDLGGPFVNTGREGFLTALDISAYSLVSIARHGSPLMTEKGGHGQGRSGERGQATRR